MASSGSGVFRPTPAQAPEAGIHPAGILWKCMLVLDLFQKDPPPLVCAGCNSVGPPLLSCLQTVLGEVSQALLTLETQPQNSAAKLSLARHVGGKGSARQGRQAYRQLTTCFHYRKTLECSCMHVVSVVSRARLS
jgi:hypothetical protein